MQPPCVVWLLSDFCKERDDSMLPIFKNITKVGFVEEWQSLEEIQRNAEWNCLNKQLLSATTDIRDCEQAAQFLEKWLLRSSDPATYISSAPLRESVSPRNDALIKDVQVMLQKRKNSTRNTFLELSSAMNIILRHKLKEIEIPTPAVTWLNPLSPPLTLIRIWDDNSHTLYTESLGFRCGNWRRCQPANDFIELENRELLNLQNISNHCEGKGSLSDWISFSNDALWILSNLSASFLSTQRNCRVAIVNVASLDRLRIPWQRSDLLVQQLGGKISDVRYAWPGHYLIYGWAPSQCVIESFTLKEFQDRCKQRNIIEGSDIRQVHPPHELL